MKKKIISAALAVSLALSLLVGCGKAQSTAASDSSPFGSDYDYVQDLNIVEDNYRNYYEIFVYSYYDSDGDGIGDLNGVIGKLDYISEMGFNGIWLMPVMSSPTYHKYDVTDYESIDEQYGDMGAFEELIEEAHKRDIRVILDLPLNHTSSQNAWFTDACSYLESLYYEQQEAEAAGKDQSGLDLSDLGLSEDPDNAEQDPFEPDATVCPYIDYYHFSKTQESSTWYQVADTDWYYEGSFWSEMPDLDLSCERLVGEIENICSFWIDKGVDGFRMDAAMHFEEDQTEFNTEFLNTLYTYCTDLNPDFYMVSEVWAPETTIADYYEGSKTPSMFNFPLSGAEGCLIKAANGSGSATDVVNAMVHCQETYSAAYSDYIDAPFLTNHDMTRVSNALQGNEDAMKMAGGLLLMMNGSPYVYYGEEIGMASKGTDDENKRLPMIWSLTDTTGMTEGPEGAATDVTQHFPGVDEQETDSTSILNYYERALRLRNENPEIARGTITAIDSLCSGDTAALTKEWDGSTIGIVYNTAEEETTVDISGTSLESMTIRGYLTLTNDQTITLDGTTLTLPGRSICILK